MKNASVIAIRNRLIETVFKFISATGQTQAEWGQLHGIGAAYLSRMLAGKVPLNQKALDALGYEKVVTVTYHPKTVYGEIEK